MAVTLNPTALAALLVSEAGPVGREVRRKADQVEELARINASGPVLGIDTGDLLAALKVTPTEPRDGTVGTAYLVGSDSEHNGFRYPGYWNENGRPWLLEALADVFPNSG